MNEFAKSWLYRSFFNQPVQESKDPSYLWARGKAELTLDDQEVTGVLDFDHPIVSSVKVTGNVEVDQSGRPLNLNLIGTNAAGSLSEISGWFVPPIEGAKEQVLAAVGSVIDKQSGTVGSFVLTESESVPV
jgi:hypothetical protein